MNANRANRDAMPGWEMAGWGIGVSGGGSHLGRAIALGLAALGGAMMPIELFSDTLASVARLTPHYWAIDAFAELIRHDGTVLDVGRQLAVLGAYTLVLLLLASWRMRRVLTTTG